MNFAIFSLALISTSAFASTHLKCNVSQDAMGGTMYLQMDFNLQTPSTADLTASGSQNANGPWTKMCSSPTPLTVDASKQEATVFSGLIMCDDGSSSQETMILDNYTNKLSTDFGSGQDSTSWDCQWM